MNLLKYSLAEYDEMRKGAIPECGDSNLPSHCHV